MGGASRSTTWRPPARARTRSSRARTATTRPTSRSRAAIPRPPDFPEPLDSPEEIETRASRRSRSLRSSRRSTRRRRQRRCRSMKDDGTVVLALVRGDDRLEEAKLAAALGADVRPATEDEIRAAFGADPARSARSASRARSSPTRRSARANSSQVRTGPAGTCEASRHGRDFEPRVRGHPQSEGRRPVPALRRRAALSDGDRSRAHLQARDTILGAARRDGPRRGRHRAADRDGLATGSGPAGWWPPPSSSTTTSDGIIWPRRSRRTTSRRSAPGPRRSAGRPPRRSSAAGFDVLLDDRDSARGRSSRTPT